ncbi:hypothetical protein HK101_010960, partial [Irineochytrium annulatum]
MDDDKKSKRMYRCRFCGQPKKGHVCTAPPPPPDQDPTYQARQVQYQLYQQQLQLQSTAGGSSAAAGAAAATLAQQQQQAAIGGVTSHQHAMPMHHHYVVPNALAIANTNPYDSSGEAAAQASALAAAAAVGVGGAGVGAGDPAALAQFYQNPLMQQQAQYMNLMQQQFMMQQIMQQQSGTGTDGGAGSVEVEEYEDGDGDGNMGVGGDPSAVDPEDPLAGVVGVGVVGDPLGLGVVDASAMAGMAGDDGSLNGFYGAAGNFEIPYADYGGAEYAMHMGTIAAEGFNGYGAAAGKMGHDGLPEGLEEYDDGLEGNSSVEGFNMNGAIGEMRAEPGQAPVVESQGKRKPAGGSKARSRSKKPTSSSDGASDPNATTTAAPVAAGTKRLRPSGGSSSRKRQASSKSKAKADDPTAPGEHVIAQPLPPPQPKKIILSMKNVKPISSASSARSVSPEDVELATAGKPARGKRKSAAGAGSSRKSASGSKKRKG